MMCILGYEFDLAASITSTSTNKLEYSACSPHVNAQHDDGSKDLRQDVAKSDMGALIVGWKQDGSVWQKGAEQGTGKDTQKPEDEAETQKPEDEAEMQQEEAKQENAAEGKFESPESVGVGDREQWVGDFEYSPDKGASGHPLRLFVA